MQRDDKCNAAVEILYEKNGGKGGCGSWVVGPKTAMGSRPQTRAKQFVNRSV